MISGALFTADELDDMLANIDSFSDDEVLEIEALVDELAARKRTKLPGMT